MFPKSYQSMRNAAAPATERQAGFFNFSNVVLPSSQRATSVKTSRALAHWDLRDSEEIRTKDGRIAPLTEKSATLRKRHFFWFLLVLVLMHLSQLMAKNDAHRGGWTPPSEPPGSVIVTSLSEVSPVQRSGIRAAETPQRLATSAPATTTDQQLPPSTLASGNEAQHCICCETPVSSCWAGPDGKPGKGTAVSGELSAQPVHCSGCLGTNCRTCC